MSLQRKIDDDLKAAMRARDAVRLSVLRMLKAALKNAAIAKIGADRELDETDAIAVVRKQIKQGQDSIDSFEKAGRAEMAEKERAEMAVLNHYLPHAMADEELRSVVAKTIAETGAISRAQMGAVMKTLTARLAGRGDGK